MTKIQSHSTSNPASISQYAAIAALQKDEKKFIADLKEVFKKRHDFTQEKLSLIPGVLCPPADGAFYLFPNVEKAIARQGLRDDIALSELLLDKAHVAVVPGTEFGAPGYIRLSYATDIDSLRVAIERIAPFISG
jgi:aspartate aminotransferase